MAEPVATSILQWYNGKPDKVTAALVIIDGLVYPAAYSPVKGWVWADGQLIDGILIEMWAPVHELSWTIIGKGPV